MKVCYAVSNFHLAELTAQPKIIKLLIDRNRYYDDIIAIVSENSIMDIFNFKPDIITSNGYKLSALMWLLNLWCRARHFVILSETPEILGFFWLIVCFFCLRRTDKIYVTSEYIKHKLANFNIKSEVVRIGLDV